MTTIATTAPATLRSRPATDVLTMLRRNLLRAVRYPGLTMFLVAGPLVMLVLFVYIFGGALGAGVMPGVAPGADGRAAYLDYITPTLFILTIVGAGQSVAISAAMDAASGIMARFKTMAISPGSVLSGQVLGTVLQSLAALVLVLGAALAMGYRPDADVLDWAALLGLFVLLGLALSWLCVAMGLNARSVETASNTPMILLLLPFLGSGFVPVETMPTAVRWFAEYQPFTPIIETVRGLLAGGAGLEGAVVAQAVGWTVAIGVAGYAWARSLYRRERRL
ncbi:ABC-2 type transport system permease protein [Rhodococcus sp. PvR044]|jgi:ABC-2 type transport system permease protein|uniref:ABC transporter permease n=1 Tax=Rhodococcus TaxID=1827 RepID=UPI000BCF8781|nr:MULTISPECIES: ABC transporter permease [Rhodococcus]MBP1158104.1 ABC-2 type transport system permease protein [Rhodococcus sp. PvR099]MCZ4554294.1 ABC transporter permease [Rhodococcus maanshanensis]PTR40566.1 ABC-2 type transport system permease protein [Rhodococcus sp. OK611]SNX92257.1 ABC-2 type transport system permease protein [Rhodococcus sp. OK270]